jgi:predicted transcriptional regulator YdeE
VFQCGLDAIGPTWQAVYNDWLAKSVEYEYEEDETRASFEYFPPGGGEEKALVSINVPLKAKFVGR